MELALTLPILGVLLFGLFEFSMLFTARSQVVEAARAGARKACHCESRGEHVEDEVHPGEKTGDDVTVSVWVPMSKASPDLLWPIGYRLAGRELHASCRMSKE